MVTTTPIDLERDLEAALDGPADLVTTSALLDLVSDAWLNRLAIEAAARRLPVYAALIAATVWIAMRVPQGFIPTLDQGYGIIVAQLPDGASLSRTDAVTRRISDIVLKTPGADSKQRKRP